jgi:hypothetical protein
MIEKLGGDRRKDSRASTFSNARREKIILRLLVGMFCERGEFMLKGCVRETDASRDKVECVVDCTKRPVKKQV